MRHALLELRIPVAAALAALFLSPLCAQADLVRLKSGGEIRGKIITGPQDQGLYVVVRTVTGSVVTVFARDVDFETRRPYSYEEYELKSRLLPETVEAHWEMSEWCREQHLSRQRDLHLEKVIELDPENEVAHRALGHIERDGEWTTLEQHMIDQGYVKFRGRYITPEEKLLLEHSREERERQKEWYSKVAMWSGWLTGRRDSQRELALKNFREITDVSAIPSLQRYLGEQESRDMRLLYIEILEQIPSPQATSALVKMSVLDGDQGLRLRSVEKIAANQRHLAVAEFIQHLRDEQNVVVRRAASGLKQLGSEVAVPQLIEALVTTHAYRIKVPNPTVGVSMGPGGAVSSGTRVVLPPDIEAGLLTGAIDPANIHFPGANSFRWETVRVNQQNPEVLDALQTLTDVDFGFDERTWKLWWMSQNS